MPTDRERIARAMYVAWPETDIVVKDHRPAEMIIPIEETDDIVRERLDTEADAALAEMAAIRSERRAGFVAALDELIITISGGDDLPCENYADVSAARKAVIAAAGFEGEG